MSISFLQKLLRSCRPDSLFVLYLPFLVGTAHAASVLDQSYLPPTSVVAQARDIDYSGQSFTVGVSGTLSQIDGLITRSENIDVDLELVLAKLDNNNLIAQIFGSVYVDYIDLPVFGANGCCYADTQASTYFPSLTEIDVSSLGIQVEAGETYAFLFHSEASWNGDLDGDGVVDSDYKRIDWFAGYPGTYSNGSSFGFGADWWEGDVPGFDPIGAQWGWGGAEHDFVFQTHVAVVPAPSSLSLLTIGLAGLGYTRRKKTK